MNNPCDLVVTLEAGTVRRVVTLREIVHEHGDAGLAGKLVALAFGSVPSSGERGEPTEGCEGHLPESGTQNAFENSELRLRFGRVEGAGGERGQGADDIERVADHLATALRDEKSLAFYVSSPESFPAR